MSYLRAKSVYAYQRNKRTPGAMFPPIQEMTERILNGQCRVIIMTAVEEAFHVF